MFSYLRIRFGSWLLPLLAMALVLVVSDAMTTNRSSTDRPLTVERGPKKTRPGSVKLPKPSKSSASRTSTHSTTATTYSRDTTASNNNVVASAEGSPNISGKDMAATRTPSQNVASSSMAATAAVAKEQSSNMAATAAVAKGQSSNMAATAAVAKGPQDFYTGESANVSRLLNSLLRGYDKRLRPNYNGQPVEVGITMFVSSVSSISEVNMDFTLDFYFRQHWFDPRLNFTGEEDELCISNEMLGQIWWPDTFFATAKMAHFHTATTHNAFLRIKPSGWITQSLRLTVTSTCAMDLTYFPMDTQICNLEIESYAYSIKHIIYAWKDGRRESIGIEKSLQLPQFSIKGYRAKNKLEVLSTGNYSRLVCEFYFARSLGYYVIHIYIPSCLIVVLSWISFWLHRDASPARVALGITTVLTMTTLISSSNASLPKISYLKAIDVFLVTCFVMVFASLLEYACVSYLGNLKWTPKARSHTDAAAPIHELGLVECGGPGPQRRGSRGRGPTAAGHGKDRIGCNGPYPLSDSPVLQMEEDVRRNKRNSCGQFSDREVLTPLTCSRLPAADQCPAHSVVKRSALCASRSKNVAGGCPSVASSEDKTKANPNVALACAIDRYSRAIFPMVFLGFKITYWVIFLHISSSDPQEADYVHFET